MALTTCKKCHRPIEARVVAPHMTVYGHVERRQPGDRHYATPERPR